MPVINPLLGKRGGNPETGILPRIQGGAASVTINAKSAAQQARLQRYLYVKSRQQYEGRIRALAQRYGLVTNGTLSNAQAEKWLKDRATWATNSIRKTMMRDIQRRAKQGLSPGEVLQNRQGYKPRQVFVTETNTANNQALRDFYSMNPALLPPATFHIEPQDADPTCDVGCPDYVAMGSRPLDDFPDFPLHVSCPHGPVPDEQVAQAEVDAAASLSISGDFWLGGLGVGDVVGALALAGVTADHFHDDRESEQEAA